MDTALYYDSLLKWIGASREYLVEVDASRNIWYYGTGDSVWGINTLDKALAAYTIASEYDEFDPEIAGMSRAEARHIAHGMLRYAVETHLVGSLFLTDGRKWGHTWISSLAFERIMHAVDILLPEAEKDVQDLFRKVQISECDWLCDEYEIVAERFNIIDKTGFIADYGKTNNRNKPESNAWNGSVLYRTAMMYPDAPRAEEYRKRGAKFFANAISVASDAQNQTVYEGETVADLFVGDNFFESYALDHHGYLNLGYAALTLSNVAMAHYAFRFRGLETPPAVFHHAKELWRYIKTCTFTDGTLCRVGGDARTRYCYCQDFMVPVLIFAKDVLRDPDAESMERAWMEKICYEQSLSGDGSYLAERCPALKEDSPLYYTRLESDRALAFSIGYQWNRLLGDTPEPDAAEAGFIPVLSEDYHGFAMGRSDKRMVSWCWRGAEGPTGLCVPPDHSDQAEYRHNMFPEICSNSQVSELLKECEHSVALFDGGFLTIGRGENYALRFHAEAEADKHVADVFIAAAALPDDAGMIVMQYAKNLHRAWLKSVKPGYLLVQNDIFNNKNRRLTYENGVKLLLTGGGDDALWDSGSTWMNFDDSLGVALCYGAPSLSLYRPSKRQIGISGRSFREEMLYAEEVCLGAKTRSFWAAEGEIIVDAAFATATGVTTEQTRAMPVPQTPVDPASALRCASVRGADGRIYTLWANFGDTPVSCQAEGSPLSVIGTYGNGSLAAGSCLLVVQD